MTTREPQTAAMLATQLEQLQRERDRYHDALIARHGGEPVALLSELDAARGECERLHRENAELRGAALEVCQRWDRSRHISRSMVEALHALARVLMGSGSAKPIQTWMGVPITELDEQRRADCRAFIESGNLYSETGVPVCDLERARILKDFDAAFAVNPELRGDGS